MRPRLTNSGYAAQLNALSGAENASILFTHIKMGNGALPADYKVLTDLQNPITTIGFSSRTVEDTYVQLQATFDNSGLSESFYWKEVGIYAAVDPETYETTEAEYLYAYGHVDLEDDGEAAANIPKYSKETYEIKLTYRIYMGESTNLATAVIASSTAVTWGDFNAHITNYNNPHRVTKAQIGLSNVQNVSVNDMTPTVKEANVLAKLINGEKMSVLMGKIAKAVAELINHITNTTMHITAAERTAWNAKANANHNHTAASITSGTFSIARGGTGCSNETDLANLIRRYASGSAVTYATGTISATGWSGNTYSFESDYPSSQKHIEVSLAPSASGEEYRAFVAAKLAGSSSGNVITALGTVPTINIPIFLTITVA